MNHNPSIQDLARELTIALYTDRRNDGTEFVRLVDDAPQWMTDACMAAHGDSMPDDTIYDFILRAAHALAEYDDENTPEIAIEEIEPDIYTYDLTAWLHSNVNHVEYLTQALEGLGNDNRGDFNGFILLSVAQQLHIQEVGFALLEALRDTDPDDPDGRVYLWEGYTSEAYQRIIWLAPEDFDYDWTADQNPVVA